MTTSPNEIPEEQDEDLEATEFHSFGERIIKL